MRQLDRPQKGFHWEKKVWTWLKRSYQLVYAVSASCTPSENERSRISAECLKDEQKKPCLEALAN